MVKTTKSQLKQNNAVNPATSPAGLQPDTKQSKPPNPRKRVTYAKWAGYAEVLLAFKADLTPLETVLDKLFNDWDSLHVFRSETNAGHNYNALQLVKEDYGGINYMVKLGQLKAGKNKEALPEGSVLIK